MGSLGQQQRQSHVAHCSKERNGAGHHGVCVELVRRRRHFRDALKPICQVILFVLRERSRYTQIFRTFKPEIFLKNTQAQTSQRNINPTSLTT